jgi:putative ABC transport system permease protein
VSRVRAALATLTSAPWRRAPFLLWRRPGLLATVAGATAVVAASLAAVPLFSSSVGSASIDLQIEERCPRDLGATRRFQAAAGSIRTPSPDPFVPVADRLGPSNWWAQLEDVPLTADGATDALEVSLLVRGGALDHVEVLESREGPGVWLSDRAADRAGLHTGGFASIGRTRVAVAGVYRDLSGPTTDDFWCSNGNLLLLEGADLIPPPPLVLVDRDTLATVMRDQEVDSVEGAWQAGLRPGLTLDEADGLLGALTCRDGVAELSWCSGGQRPRVPGSATGPSRNRLIEVREEAEFANRFLESSLPFAIERTRAIQTSVGGGIWAIAALATLAGLGLVAAAAGLWLDRRRREVTLLAVRGVSPAGVGTKAVLELIGPLVVGAAAGVAGAYAMVAWLGPSPELEPDAIRGAALAGAAAMLAALVTTGAVVAVRAGAEPTGHRRRAWLSFLPWELLLAGVTYVSYQRLGEWGVPTGRGAKVSRVDLWGLLFPVLFLVTAVAALSRVLALAIRPLRAVSRSWPTALYLGIRRVARYRVAAIGLVAGSSLAAGVLGYAATMNRSLDTSLQAKGRTFVGSDVALRLSAGEPIPADLAARATEARLYRQAWVQRDRRESLEVWAIDPDTFGQAAFWDESFGEGELDAVVDQLRSDAASDSVPAVVVGGDFGDRFDLAVIGSRTRHVMIESISNVTSFPGMNPHEPTAFVDASAFDRLGIDGFLSETWVRGDPDEIHASLGAAGTGFQEARTRSGIADRAAFRTVAWTFGFLQTIGVSAGLLVIGGLAVYLDARSRHRLLGYSIMRRMGLGRGRHRRALAVELTASVLVGAVVGLAISVAAAALAYGHIDPVPRYPPDPLLRLAVPTIGVLLLATGVLTVVAVALGQRRMDRDDPVEVLRAGA